MLDWLHEYDVVLGWLIAVSSLMFLGSLLSVPLLVIRIPADYFLRRRHFVDRFRPRHPLLRAALLAAKNLCGATLVVAGVAMLLLPGQGMMTILVGLMFLDFPGKFALEQRLVRYRPVTAAMNWMRAKANRPAIMLPEADH